MIKTRTWIIIIAALFTVSALAALWLHTRGGSGTVANIYVDGVCLRSVDLSAVSEPYSFTLENRRGMNRIEVEPGRIRVAEADCPDGVCLRMGWHDAKSGAPIVCLPHRLVIRVESEVRAEDGVDAVTQ